jgi:PAS domain S-box-containing protein
MVSIAGRDQRDTAGQLGVARELVMSMPVAVAYLRGPDLVYEFANEEFLRVVGVRAPAGRPIGAALPELSAEHVQAVRQLAMTGQGHRWREPETLIRRHGRISEPVFVLFAYQPVRDADGIVTGVLQYATDVTEHVQDRRKLEALAELSTATEEQYLNLFQTLPQGVVYYGADGSVLAANPAAREILGLEPGAITSWPLIRDRIAYHEDGSPYRRDEFPVMVALNTGQIVANQLVGLSRGPAGEHQWLRVTAIPDARDEQGRPQRAYVMFSDVTEQRRGELALREGSRLLGGLRDANLLGVVVADETHVIEANDAYLDIIGYTREEFDSEGIDWRAITPPEWADSDEDALAQLRRIGVYQPYEKEYVHRDGHRVPILVGGAVTDWRPLRWAAFVVDLTARQRAQDERAGLLAREQAARVEADGAQERLEFLLRAGDLVAATRNRDDLLEKVTQLVVPTLADYCVAFAPVAGGKLAAAKLTHRDPDKGEALKLLREHPIPAMGPLIVQKAYATGTTQIAREFTARTPRWSDAEPGLINLADKVNPTSALAVPLVVAEQPLGVLLLGRGHPRPLFAETDVAIVEVLARRLAAGLANAETFARDHTVAETLQRALLPAALPKIEGLDLAVHYLPASDGVHVGGDWYDAFPLSRGRVGLVIGDVAGHSIDSASIMGQIRSLLHGYAIDNAAPAEVLRRTNAAVSQMLPDAVATACYAVLDTATGNLRYASAGHPPVLVTTGRGHAEYLEGPPGIMLGVSADATFAVGHRRLPPGTGLLLYTDGLIEHRHLDIADGLVALQTALERSSAKTAEELCDFVQATVIGSAPRADDVCILAARLPDVLRRPGATRTRNRK